MRVRPRSRARPSVLAALLAALLALAGCGGDAATTGGGGQALTELRIMVPNSPGGGYDMTARTAAKAMETAGLARSVEVFNLPGAGGTVGLARTVNEEGNGKLAMLMGLGLVGSTFTNKSEVTLVGDTIPLARLIAEPDIIIVPAGSPFQTLDDLIAAWKADPGGVPVGGGSSPGGPDHLAPMLVAEAIGLDPRQVNFVSYDGGGDLLASVLGGEVAFGVTGVGETLDQIEAGAVRVLAVTSAERVEGIDAPTLREAGVDVEFANWRGLVAPPGIDDAERDALLQLIEELHATQEWKEALERNGWTDAYLAGEEFTAFLESETTRVEQVLAGLGLA